MAATLLGSLLISLGLESGQFRSGLSDAEKQMKATQKKFSAIGSDFQKAGAILSVGITAPFTALVTAAIPAAIESQQALAQVNAALKSMGPVSGHTSAELVALAGHLQDISKFDDDDILKSVTANLLTFGNVSGKVFDEAQQAIVDISARMGTDLQSATIMVGKALNDPIKGMKALSRAGIQFTDAQKEQIQTMVEAGNVTGAQTIMLGELQKQFGGAAAAQRAATPGADSQQAWRTFQETIGAVGLQVLPAFTNAATGLLNTFNQLSPGMQSVAIGTAAVAAGIGPVLIGVGSLIKVGGVLLPLLVQIGPALAALGPLLYGIAGTLVTSTIPAIGAFLVAMSPILLPLAAVAGAIALVVATVRHWDQIKAFADRVVGYMAALYTGVKTWLVDKLSAVWAAVTAPIKAVGDAFFGLYDRVVGHSYVPDMVDEIGVQMARLDENMVSPAKVATGAVSAAFQKMQQELQPILERLFPEQAAWNTYQTELAALERDMAKLGYSTDQAAEAKRRLFDEYERKSGAGGDPVTLNTDIGVTEDSAATQAGTAIDHVWTAIEKQYPQIGAANDNLKTSFADTFKSIADSIGGLATNIKSGDWLSALSSVLDIFTKLGSAGVFGSGFAAKINAPINGARALGGPVMPHGSYLVGEKGPEILRMGGSGGSIIPNNDIGPAGGMITLHVVGEEGPLFRPVVRAESAGQAVTVVNSTQKSNARRSRQRYA